MHRKNKIPKCKEYISSENGQHPPIASPNLSRPALSAVIQTDRLCSILQTEQRKASQFKMRGVLSVLRGYIFLEDIYS